MGAIMKAVLVHEYGGPEVLKYEDFSDPVAKSGEVLIRVVAAGINPVDLKRRSGAMKGIYPIQFPGILGMDVAGTIAKVGPGVQGWMVGDQVAAFIVDTYAELCVLNASTIAKVPDGLAVADAAVLPVVVTTGSQLITEGTGIKSGQTVLVTGAAGNVGRSAVFEAKQRGARVIAGVRKKQLDAAATLGADSVVATDDDAAMAKLPPLDAVADTVAGNLAEMLIRKVKTGGVFASTLGTPANAKEFPMVKSIGIVSKPDAAVLRRMAEAVLNGKLTIPIARRFPLKDAAAAHAAIESGLHGKVLLLA
jgi:NADPH:quinone reductase-like Zn-dependent oxidoreductase